MPNLTVEEVEFSSPYGAKLSVENNILYPPAVFLDGKLLAKGKIDANKLTTTIRESNVINI